MSIDFLDIMATLLIVSGLTLLFINKESPVAIKLKDYIHIQTKSVGVIVVLIGASIEFAKIVYRMPNSDVIINDVSAEHHQVDSLNSPVIKTLDTQQKKTLPPVAAKSASVSPSKARDTFSKVRMDTVYIPLPNINESKYSETKKVMDADDPNLALCRNFFIRTSSPTVRIRYVYGNVDTAYAVPLDFTFNELATALINHFHRNCLLESVLLNNVGVSRHLTLKETGVKDDDRIRLQVRKFRIQKSTLGQNE